jgi:hypothetical protein
VPITASTPLAWALPVPLRVHGRTCREEACAEVLAAYCCAEALRLRCRRRPARRPPQPPRGRALAPAHRCGAFTGPLFITLRKSEALFSPTTRYHDLALGPSLSHWESQSTTTAASATGQRYIHHEARGSRVLLFVREQRRKGGVTEPFVRLGFARYESHEGERIWFVPEWRFAGGWSGRSRRRGYQAVVSHTSCCLA